MPRTNQASSCTIVNGEIVRKPLATKKTSTKKPATSSARRSAARRTAAKHSGVYTLQDFSKQHKPSVQKKHIKSVATQEAKKDGMKHGVRVRKGAVGAIQAAAEEFLEGTFENAGLSDAHKKTTGKDEVSRYD
ncbi:hypothetical protein AAVH_12970 [Aphelenchoides avenae]|nr:hypothetical protein AAVH_12970 [Aphelenchus avenae]